MKHEMTRKTGDTGEQFPGPPRLAQKQPPVDNPVTRENNNSTDFLGARETPPTGETFPGFPGPSPLTTKGTR